MPIEQQEQEYIVVNSNAPVDFSMVNQRIPVLLPTIFKEYNPSKLLRIDKRLGNVIITGTNDEKLVRYYKVRISFNMSFKWTKNTTSIIFYIYERTSDPNPTSICITKTHLGIKPKSLSYDDFAKEWYDAYNANTMVMTAIVKANTHSDKQVGMLAKFEQSGGSTVDFNDKQINRATMLVQYICDVESI